MLRGPKQGTLMIAKTPKAQIHFELTYEDLYKNSAGEVFLLRNYEAGNDIKKDCEAVGLTVEEQ